MNQFFPSPLDLKKFNEGMAGAAVNFAAAAELVGLLILCLCVEGKLFLLLLLARAPPPQRSCPAFVLSNHILRHLKRHEFIVSRNLQSYTAELRVPPPAAPASTTDAVAPHHSP